MLAFGLLLAACTTSSNTNDSTGAEPPASETDTAAGTGTGPDADTDTDEITSADPDALGGGAANLLASVNPFDLLNGLGGTTDSTDVDPLLKRSLLDAGDVPSDFFPLGEFSISTPSEFGDMNMVANMFVGGDITSADFGQFSMVMSAAILLPPEALEELGDFDDLDSLISKEFEAYEADAGDLGDFADFELLDGSSLGDGGFGMHIEMDFASLAAGFGLPEGELGASGIAMDTYAFFHGEEVLMVVTMWPTDQSSGVDAYALAEEMDS